MHGGEFRNIPTGGAEGEAPRARVVNLTKAAELLGGITRRQVDLKVARGELVKVKDGGRALITVASIEAHIDQLLKNAGVDVDADNQAAALRLIHQRPMVGAAA